ncbi:MAG: diaminopimelate epimerase [Firmicutes bacterium]|nr:diaminopimelate epimerase [Bacillota bacterium]
MKFTKMQGAGNDFIIVDNRLEKIKKDQMGGIARKLCQRRMSVGADGVMFLESGAGKGADVDMLFYNADGNAGEMCGNGARCVSRFAYEHGFSKGKKQYIATPAGMVVGERIDETSYRIRLNDISVVKDAQPVEFRGTIYLCDYMEMGDPGLPHVALEIQGLKSIDKESLRPLGEYLRHYFPKGANVDFYELLADGTVELITYERYVEDFTFACGTGTGCVVSDLLRSGRVDAMDTKVHVPGGELSVTIEGGSAFPLKGIYLTGPTLVVYEGETQLF